MASDFVEPKLTLAERAATSMTLMAYARMAVIILTVMTPPATGLVLWMINRLVNSMDRINEQQIKTGQDYARLETKVTNIVSDQVTSVINIGNRIDQGEKFLNDRLNVQATWLQQLTSKYEELSKYVYTKVR